MKVTRDGTTKEAAYFVRNPLQVYRGSCGKCKTEYEALEKELRASPDTEDIGWAYGAARCTRCGYEYAIFRPVKGMVAAGDGTMPVPNGFWRGLWDKLFGA